MTAPLFDVDEVTNHADAMLHAAALKASRAPVFAVRVYGTPGPQGSKKGFYNKHLKRVQMVESSAKVTPWRDAVRADSVQQRGTAEPIAAAVLVDLVFTFARPRSHYRTGRNAHLLKPTAPARPSGKPDLDKLARSTGDALKDAGVIADDSLIVEYGRLAKVYASEDIDALDAPGAVIRIHLIGAPA